AFWEDTLAKVAASADWKAFLEENDLAPQLLRGRDFAKYLEGEYSMTKAMMGEVGLTKGP
ncbi:MAG: hypothetical protein ACXWUH_19680, partial [Burkholderiales bacterium]